MNAPKRPGPGRPRTRSSIPARQTLMIHPHIYEQVERLAKRWGTSRSDVVNKALDDFTQRKLIESDQEHVSGVVFKEVYEGMHMVVKPLRALVARNGMETLRLQYILFHFMNTAGIAEARIEKWREDGWNYAVREYRKGRSEIIDEPNQKT